ncbi:MAG: cupredoxin domain-containing protein [Rubrobacteraceae bacterium]|nr:cupredoxin domain-containing protein [Rubrobacter sp.]
MTVRIAILTLISVLVLGGLFVLLRPNPKETSPGKRSFDLEISEDGMSPTQISIREGDRVTLNVTTDSPVEMHVHGYDLEKEVEPGETTEISFEADLTGRFPIEDHDTETELGALVVEPR